MQMPSWMIRAKWATKRHLKRRIENSNINIYTEFTTDRNLQVTLDSDIESNPTQYRLQMKRMEDDFLKAKIVKKEHLHHHHHHHHDQQQQPRNSRTKIVFFAKINKIIGDKLAGKPETVLDTRKWSNDAYANEHVSDDFRNSQSIVPI